MRTFIVFIFELDAEYRSEPRLIVADSLLDLFHILDKLYGDFECVEEHLPEEAMAEQYNMSNGDGDRWYSVSEVIEGPALKVWLR